MIDEYGFWRPNPTTPESIQRAVDASLKAERAREAIRRGEVRADSVGELVEHVRIDDTGRKIRTFTGPKSAWMNHFKAPGVRILKFDKDPKVPDFRMMPGGSTLTLSENIDLAMNRGTK